MNAAEQLLQGKVGVIPTDTLYACSARALDQRAVERAYDLKGRTSTKPCIILIASNDVLDQFVTLTNAQREVLSQYWPGPVSLVFACKPSIPEYLHRGTHTLAFRLPKDDFLRALLTKTGPLIAPSANPEGLPPAITVAAARTYFGANVDFYVDGGELHNAPSKIIRVREDGACSILRA